MVERPELCLVFTLRRFVTTLMCLVGCLCM